MVKVRGTKHVRMVVVPYNPVRRWGLLIVAAASVLALAVFAYLHGFRTANADYYELVEDRTVLQRVVDNSAHDNEQLQRQLAQVQMDADIDRRATSEVREEIAGLNKKIADLSKEISFYKGLMAPTAEERGLRIRSLDVVASDDPRKYELKLVLQQLAVEHKILYGYATINIVGKQNGSEIVLSLGDVSKQIDGNKVRVRFKYYQNIEGTLLLPEGFEPQGIAVVIDAKAKKARRGKAEHIEKKFGWVTQEA
ncbi:MAG: DUF6776 family protein [Pseudomonadales bacterium]